MADTQVLEACAVRRRGSSPLSRTRISQPPSRRKAAKMSQTPTNQPQPQIVMTKSDDYRDSYANSVQVRLSVWDFLLIFGKLEHQSQSEVTVENFQGVYLSPQQAKALQGILNNNIAQYEQTFGPIALTPPDPEAPAAPRTRRSTRPPRRWRSAPPATASSPPPAPRPARR